MTEQLFDVPPKLTYFQYLALVYIRGDGATALDVGVYLHLSREPRCKWCVLAGDTGCQYAESTGRQTLKALSKKGLAIRRRTGLWQQRDATKKASKDHGGLQGDLPVEF